ncbi:MBL fold metallo-hydrolase [Actinocrinis puniceicyclus]|uniref:MBL fold metallo-hydrolase n=1 Tax=Actinocrinis puniceicyclus TaxID=977794 RepID=A0A8J8BB88_9ACTN|nr:MBL fold metallo-hydrolase [Actinocrinis puniceicyclus]MBS2961836.1 MBL fold metallo-hydrolase [Actinocrinis puniceicyclus]
MRVTWLGHAGLRIERDEYTLVVDPGAFCDQQALGSALDDADGLLITHEHFDHFAADPVRAALARKNRIEVWTNSSVAALLDGTPATVHTVADGSAFAAGGIEVRAFGEWHARIHRDIPLVRNTGFLIDGKVFHPGDALTDPQVPVELLLVPSHGPWTRTGDLIDFVRELKPRRMSPIHDAMLSPIGKNGLEAFLSEQPGYGPGTGVPYSRLTLGEPFEI